MTRPWLCLALSIAPTVLAAQGAWQVDGSVGVGADGHRVAVSLLRDLRGAGSGLQVAVGGRLTWYGGDTVAFTLRGEPGGCVPGVIDCVPPRVDLAPAVVGVNLFGELAFRVARRVTIGANLDLVGVAIGPERGGRRPARGSLFLYGNRDRGSLNSEFFGAVTVSERVSVRAGMSHYVVGYDQAGDGGGRSRYQRFFDAGFVAVRLRR